MEDLMTKWMALGLLISLMFVVTACQKNNAEELFKEVIEAVTFDSEVNNDLYLPNRYKEVLITWESSDEEILSSKGKVNRPLFDEENQEVTLTMILNYQNQVKRVLFTLTVVKNEQTREEILKAVLDQIEFGNTITESLNLVYEVNGVLLSYQSSHPMDLTNEGDLLRRPYYNEDDLSVTLTVTGFDGEYEMSKDITLIILKEEKLETNVTGFASIYFDESVFNEGNYYVVSNEKELIEALSMTGDKAARVIEIMNDLNLGYHYVRKTYPELALDSRVFRNHNTPLTHPDLIEHGVSRIQIRDRSEGLSHGVGLKLFSKNGSTIKYATFLIKNSTNVWIENLSFDGIWEYDDSFDYDRNDYDYITIEDSKNVFINHVTLHQAYDGLIDVKGYSDHITISNSLFVARENEHIRRQVDYLEDNRSQFPTYNAYRTLGMTKEELVTLLSFQKKGHLIGSGEFNDENKYYTVTLSNNHYINILDRIPRLRGGDVHMYNIIHDASEANAFRTYVNVTYKISFTNQGIVTTENGAVLMENSIFKGINTPIRNNQKSGAEGYTGKFLVRASIYQLGNYYDYSSSTDKLTIWRANDAAVLPFELNNYDEIPYDYQMISALDLESHFEVNRVGANNNLQGEK